MNYMHIVKNGTGYHIRFWLSIQLSKIEDRKETKAMTAYKSIWWIPLNFQTASEGCTVGIFGLSRRTCNFCALKRACFAQKWSYITHKTTFKKIKHFFEKQIFDEKYLGGGGPYPNFFEKSFLFENVLCHTSSDAVSCADSEYHLIF